MTLQCTHLVLSGGGISGMVYLGALKYLQQEGYDRSILHISGSSIGAFFATAFALSIPMNDLETRFKTFFKDTEKCILPVSYDSIVQTYDTYGLDDGKRFISLLDDFLGHITFLELTKKTGKNLIISTTHVTTMQPTYFSVDTTPHIIVADAVRASMAIPLFVRPVEIGEDLYVDGGITDGIPVEPFINVPEKLILILHLSQKFEKKIFTTKPTFLQFITSMLETYLSNYLGIRLLTNTYSNYCRFKKCPISFLPIVWENESLIMKVDDSQIDASVTIGFQRMQSFIHYSKTKTQTQAQTKPTHTL
jgi:NTE family protein